jgi:hypothetical protein
VSEDPKQPRPDKDVIVGIEVCGEAVLPHALVFSYGAIKDAKRRILQNLSGSGAATVVEIVIRTALSFDLASVVIGDLETEGKVTVKVNDGLKWVELKKQSHPSLEKTNVPSRPG